MTPRVSIVVVTYNDREKLLDCLRSLEAQAFPPADRETIVVDDGSTDGSAAAVRAAFPRARVIEKANSGADNSRNCGVAAARGEIVAFIDSDCVAPPGWLATLVRRLEARGVSIVGGRIRHQGSLWARLIGVSDFGEFQGPDAREVSNIPTCNMGARRALFERFAFHPELRVAGDVLFCSQLREHGQRLLYDPRLEVIHRPRASAASFFRRARAYGRGFVIVRRLEPSLPGGRFVRWGWPGIVCVTLGRTALDWYRLFRYRRAAGILRREVPAALAVLLAKRCVSLLGALEA